DTSARTGRGRATMLALGCALGLGVVASISGAAAPPVEQGTLVSLVRLTPEQYRHSIHDLFGRGVQVRENNVAPGFRDEGLLALGNRKLTITSAEMEQYEKLAQDI